MGVCLSVGARELGHGMPPLPRSLLTTLDATGSLGNSAVVRYQFVRSQDCFLGLLFGANSAKTQSQSFRKTRITSLVRVKGAMWLIAGFPNRLQTVASQGKQGRAGILLAQWIFVR